jgi:hypothetical protein
MSERRKEYLENYRKQNKEQIREKRKNWENDEDKREKHRQQQKDYYKKNKIKF